MSKKGAAVTARVSRLLNSREPSSNKKGLYAALLALPIFLAEGVKAHCPLCTIGAGAAAAGAVYLGVSPAVVAILIGAFAMSMAMWSSTWLDKKLGHKNYMLLKYPAVIIALVFLSTIIPIVPMLATFKGFNIFLYGSYGSLLNNSYMYNLSWVTSLLGAVIVFVSPKLNTKIKLKRKKQDIPFQGIAITLSMLIVVAGLFQLGLLYL